MGFFELLLIAVGLSMDAFAVAVCKGLSTTALKPKHYAITGAWFGGFQALMPTIGFFIGSVFSKYIESIDHWVILALLCLIGFNMIKEGLSKCETGCDCDASFNFKNMLIMAIATSIDALAVGITFALSGANIWFGALLIGAITFSLSAVGLKVGNIFGVKYKSKAEIAGGIILILIGVKILLEHLEII